MSETIFTLEPLHPTVAKVALKAESKEEMAAWVKTCKALQTGGGEAAAAADLWEKVEDGVIFQEQFLQRYHLVLG